MHQSTNCTLLFYSSKQECFVQNYIHKSIKYYIKCNNNFHFGLIFLDLKILMFDLKCSFACFLFSSIPMKQTRGVPQDMTRMYKIVKILFEPDNMRMLIRVSRIQLNMLNFIVTIFLCFLICLALLLNPGTLESCL